MTGSIPEPDLRHQADLSTSLYNLKMHEYEEIVERAGKALSDDYLVINGNAYVLGEEAEHYGVINRRVGPERYTPDYYGAFVGAMLYRMYKSNCSVALFASHQPGMLVIVKT